LITTPDFDLDAELKIFRFIVNRATNYHFLFDENNMDVIRNLLHYFNNSPEGDMDPTKGICLMGPIGSGKSELMRIFKWYCNIRMLRMYRILSSEELRIKYQIEGGKVIQIWGMGYTSEGTIIDKADLCIDEFGLEETSRHYGDQEQVISSILFLRYDLFRCKGSKTHITTNLNKTLIEKNNEGRLASRFNEMFNFVKLSGPDRRKIIK